MAEFTVFKHPLYYILKDYYEESTVIVTDRKTALIAICVSHKKDIIFWKLRIKYYNVILD